MSTNDYSAFTPRTIPNTASQLTFLDYLLRWSEHIKREGQKTRKLCEMSITMHRRDRGLTLSDMCGRFGIRRDTEGRWLDYDQDLDGEIHPINIVKPALETNKNACLQSNSQTEVKSANASAREKQIAMRWQKVADYFERTGWNEEMRGFMFDAGQKDGTVWVDTYAEKCGYAKVPNVQPRMQSQYECNSCGHGGVIDPAELEEEVSEGMPHAQRQFACPQCGAGAEILEIAEGYDVDESDAPTYEIKDEVIPFYNFFIDTYGAKIGGIQSADWCEIHQLWSRMKCETMYPEIMFPGPGEWSYPTRCDYALSNADWGYLNSQMRGSIYSEYDRFEVRSIYLHEDAYKNYRAPADCEFVNGAGEKTFVIKKGQTIGEAQEALYGENQHGFMFIWCDQMLLDIPTPEGRELNFRKKFADMHWSRDSGAYLSSPYYSIVYIQDDITLLNTLNHNIVARNSVIPVYYDSEVFEQSDFSKEYIGTKNAHLLPDRDISKGVWSLPIPTPSPYVMNQMEWLWNIKDAITMVTPAMRGEEQKGAPYAAQRQQLEQSYGGLTSVLKSFAQCKVKTFLNKANLAKKFWTLEQFQRVGSMFGELWTNEDIEEMRSADFERDLIVSYRDGSEMPSSNLSREMKFYGALGQLLPLLQLGVPIDPEKWQKILAKIDEYGEFDFDLTGLEVNELIAQKRVIDLSAMCQPFDSLTFEQVDQMKQTIVSVEPPTPEQVQESIEMAQSAPDDPNVQAQAQQLAAGNPITQMDIVLEQIIAQSHIRFSQYEDLPQQHAFFVETLRNEIGKTKPNYIFIEVLTNMLATMEQAIQADQQEKMASDPQLQAAQAADQSAKEDAQAQLQLEAAKLESENANQEADRQLEREKLAVDVQRENKAQAIDVAKTAAAQEHDMAKTEMAAKAAKDKPKAAGK